MTEENKIHINRKAMGKRVMIYLLGVVVLACGITLNTKTNLGVSPIISVAYCVSEISGFGLGQVTFIWYMLMIAVQAALLGRDFKPLQLLQVVASFLTSWFISFFNAVLPMAESMPGRLTLLALAILITSCGIILTVGMDLVPNPADGLANVLALKLKKNLGFGKNLFDLTSITISIVVGLVVAGHLVGIGLGTVMTMIFTGRVVALINRFAASRCKKVVADSRGEEIAS